MASTQPQSTPSSGDIPALSVETRALVLCELFPVDDTTNADELQVVFQGVFSACRSLYDVAKTLHRDISITNIMYRRDDDDVILGVLNDFDHSVEVGGEASLSESSYRRVGTAPFMAIDIMLTIPPLAYLYRHDLESLYYVMVYLVVERENKYVEQWFRQGGTDMAMSKQAFFSAKMPSPRPDFEVFTPWLKGIYRMFRLGFIAQIDFENGDLQVYDPKTLGDHVTFDTYSKVLGMTS